MNETLKERRLKLGLTLEEVGNIVGVGKSTVRKWEQGMIENMGRDKIVALSKALKISPIDILEIEVPETLSSIYNQLEQPRQQKVYNFAENELEEQHYIEEHSNELDGQAAAGVPIEGQQPVPFIGKSTVRLLVNGDSMEPEFSNGDVIEYHPQPELENGEIGVFAVNGGITMKKFRRNSDIRLESLNKKYEDIVIKETDDFSILGKVII
jgi:SOS-response transcriptional repressor LexA